MNSPLLTVSPAPTYIPEREYILHVLLREFLGLDYRIQYRDNQREWCITTSGNKKIILPDILFQTPKEMWLTRSSFPEQPLQTWDVPRDGLNCNIVEHEIPIIYGLNPDDIAPSDQQLSNSTIKLPVDIFGACFFMLTRYEEIVEPDRDDHNRFPAVASLAFQEGFLSRPIVNEYVEILWKYIKWLWPWLHRKPREFRNLISCDVDNPVNSWATSLQRTARKTVGDIVKRHSIREAFKSIEIYRHHKQGRFYKDPFYTFEWMMDVCDKAGVTITFNFICNHSAGTFDAYYSMDAAMIRQLLRRIYMRGHQIGLHASYHSYRNLEQIQKEFKILKRVCDMEGIEQNHWGGRQHFLRWQTPITFQIWDDAGLDYDSTLAFADHAGFRCGTCYEYPTFDLTRRKLLKLFERPLIVMDCTVIDDCYMGYGSGEGTLELMVLLKERCRQFNGDFTLVWHNNRLVTETEKNMYQEILTND